MGRSWRLIATTILFAVFGTGGLVAGVTAFPVIALVSRDPEQRTRRARAVVGASFRAFVWLMQAMGVARFDVDREACARLAAERGNIVVANHPTLIDVVFLLAYVDQANCVVKAAVWHSPFLRWGVRCASYIPNEDLDTLMESCKSALRAGETLIVFPEATRTVPGRPIRLQRGAANIALRTGASLRLVHIKCDPPTLSKVEPWYRVPSSQPCFSMKVGGSLQSRDFLSRGEHFGVAARRLTSALQIELSKDVPADEGIGRRAQRASD